MKAVAGRGEAQSQVTDTNIQERDGRGKVWDLWWYLADMWGFEGKPQRQRLYICVAPGPV